MNDIILWGAGATGRYVLKFMRERGEIPAAFADNDPAKWNRDIDRVPILSPGDALAQYPEATWVASVISPPAAEVRMQMAGMGVRTAPLWEMLPVFHGLPPWEAERYVLSLCADTHSRKEFTNQLQFRKQPNYAAQLKASPIGELYFPPFISHRDDEHFVDCGACDGDTVKLFMERWEKWRDITAFEPDQVNFDEMLDNFPPPHTGLSLEWSAVGDSNDNASFSATGDYSAHLDPEEKGKNTIIVPCVKLDDYDLARPPTYIKMDIEGSELEALWGARRILKEHSPVLAICAYHTSDHIWQIPMLINAIQPTYKLFFRRYAEGAFEIVWYAVPSDRIL